MKMNQDLSNLQTIANIISKCKSFVQKAFFHMPMSFVEKIALISLKRW